MDNLRWGGFPLPTFGYSYFGDSVPMGVISKVAVARGFDGVELLDPGPYP